MDQVTVMNLGVGALQIDTGERRILVDAFNSLTNPPVVLSGDIILFTHDDEDHFNPDILPDVKGQQVIIIGPPSILKPILIREKAKLEQIEALYSNNYAEPTNISLDYINICCYHTKHFNHWEPLHNSYLIKVHNKKLYITGDSLLTKELSEKIGETDAVICNLVEEGFLKATEAAEVSIQHTLSYLLKVRSEVKTKLIIGIHLLEFPWTVEGEALKTLVDINGFTNIIIPVSAKEKIVIE